MIGTAVNSFNEYLSLCLPLFQGIDPLSLDMLAKEGIVALRRAKRRNMERYFSFPSIHHCSGVWKPINIVTISAQLSIKTLVFKYATRQN